ncbi:MAG: hypothetical protein ACRDVP_00875 [Acidimicrobiales bacterium]
MGTSLGAGATIGLGAAVVAGVAAATTLTTVFAPATVAPLKVGGSDLVTLSNLAH